MLTSKHNGGGRSSCRAYLAEVVCGRQQQPDADDDSQHEERRKETTEPHVETHALVAGEGKVQ